MIVLGILIVFLIVWGSFLMNGKGMFLLAGYNTMSKEKKDEYDTAALAKFVGKMAFTLAFSNLLTLIGDLRDIELLTNLGMVLTLVLIVYLVGNLNLSKKYKR